MAVDVERLDDGEEIPGTYCPLCGNIGLLKATVGDDIWAFCPFDAGNPDITDPKKAHTGYVYAKTSKRPSRPSKSITRGDTGKEDN